LPSSSFQRCRARPALPSFPTRRSSDLGPPLSAERPVIHGVRREALAVSLAIREPNAKIAARMFRCEFGRIDPPSAAPAAPHHRRSEEHTSELQSRENLVCRLLLEKKKL